MMLDVLFCVEVRIRKSNTARMSAAGEGWTEPNLYFRPLGGNANESVLPCWMFCRNRHGPPAGERIRLLDDWSSPVDCCSMRARPHRHLNFHFLSEMKMQTNPSSLSRSHEICIMRHTATKAQSFRIGLLPFQIIFDSAAIAKHIPARNPAHPLHRSS